MATIKSQHFSIIAMMVMMIVSILVTKSSGHVFRLGDCPKVDVLKDFDLTKFTGKWFIIQKFRTSSNCVTENVTRDPDSGDYYITENLEPLGLSLSQKGKVSFTHGEPSSMLKVSYPITAPLGEQNYWVMMTDYDNYAAVWQCNRVLFGHRESGQIMSRKPTLDAEIIRKIRKQFESFGINEHYMSIIDQSVCKWNEEGKLRRDAKDSDEDSNLSFKLGPIKINHSP